MPLRKHDKLDLLIQSGIDIKERNDGIEAGEKN